jgi:hypothetical protein
MEHRTLDRYDLVSTKPGPTRLMLGGIHGREWKTTTPILLALVEEGPPPSGRMVLVPRLSPIGSKHLSTLSHEFYETEEGTNMLALISELRPQIYVELHCYKRSAYKALTDPGRRKSKGVPPFIDLEEGLLIGSTSQHVLPYLEMRMGITLEVPCQCGKKALTVLRVLRDSASVQEALGNFMAMYPMEMRKALIFYNEWRFSIRS